MALGLKYTAEGLHWTHLHFLGLDMVYYEHMPIIKSRGIYLIIHITTPAAVEFKG